MTQAQLAERLGISASYQNLIENNRRPLPAELLIKVAQLFDLDLRELGGEGDASLLADLQEVFSDPVFEEHRPPADALRDLAANHETARGVVHLFHAFQTARSSAQTLAEKALDPLEVGGVDSVRLSSEQVSELIQRHANYFPELERAAESLWNEAKLEDEDLFTGLARFLEARHGVLVRIEKVSAMRGALRRFDGKRRELLLSEVLRRGSRNFQLAHQVGLLTVGDVLDVLAQDSLLTSDESRRLGRVALANYFASAVLMPYDEFLGAMRDVRYDIDLLGHRFRASFEQVCHRLTTMRRPGAEGISFHMIRVDMAGNISKKYSATGVHFPRFSGLCPLWNVHAAFLRPGMIRTQISRLPDGTLFFSVGRTIRKHRGGYHARNVLFAIGLGCSLQDARDMVYAHGIDLSNIAAAVPVGITCRLCERMDCEARAFPPLQQPLQVDENVLGVSFYAPLHPTDPTDPADLPETT